MTDRFCDKLDDYLGGWLEEADRRKYEAHLPTCEQCREEIERQQRVDSLLARAGARLEPLPTALTERVHCRLASAQWRLRLVKAAAGLAAAAALALAVWLWPERPIRQSVQPVGPIADVQPAPLQPSVPPTVGAPESATPAQQLAVLLVSQCGSSCPTPHRWTQVPEFTSPATFVPVHHTARTGVVNEETPPPTAPVAEPVEVVRSRPAEAVSCIGTRETLGTRRFAQGLFQ